MSLQGCFIIVVVVVLGMGLGPEDRLKPEEQYPPLHDVHVLWAADADKVKLGRTSRSILQRSTFTYFGQTIYRIC